MLLPEFVKFPSIPRLCRDMVITEKLDGTNAQILITEAGEVIAGSRNRWITPEDDNFGFAKWVHEHRDELLALGVGSHFGEWWGNGIQRGYGLPNGDKRFSLFNVARWEDDTVRPKCCGVVPVLYRGPFRTDTIDNIMLSLAINGSVASEGFMQPEGAIIWHEASRSLFKQTLDGDGHKGDKR